MEENNSRARVKICYFLLIFLSQILQNYFKVFLLALSFEIVQDICRRPVKGNNSYISLSVKKVKKMHRNNTILPP
jgi:hypothetical protein